MVERAPAASRKMVTSRAGWMGMARDEESRAYLQSRLVLMSKLMFWSFIVLLGSMVALYAQYPKKEPDGNRQIYIFAAIGVVTLAVIWRGFLLRRQLKLEWLYAIDFFYAAGTGSIFASAAYIASSLRLSAMVNLIWAILITFLRTIVVPSTGRRTAIAGTLVFLPLMLAAVGLAITTPQELPPDAYVASALMISVTVVLLATIGSRVIYGLRRQADVAMRLGQYTLDNKIADGGNGSVYRAHHALLRRPTAIKLMLPDRIGAETVDRFEREVQHMSRLTHWNNVSVYDYGRNPDGMFYYAMEYLDGLNLENLVIDFGRQPADRVIAILRQVCAALNEAHRLGIIHRDIKPANIILCHRGDVPDVAKVVDYGLVKEITAEKGESMILGTPSYVAPEAVTDPATVGPAADLYAVGLVGYFLLTGRRAFEGNTTVDVCVQHVTAQPKSPSSHGVKMPAELEQLILQCLAKQPSGRPADAGTLAKLLAAVPPAGDWSEDEAQRWWSDFRKLDRPTAASADTLTITVDIEDRDEAGAA
ncbi:MAG TPA: protein kinase [Kofleriaceae bacterium]|nr:protein kinase [Kofleriaceae bacterium]